MAESAERRERRTSGSGGPGRSEVPSDPWGGWAAAAGAVLGSVLPCDEHFHELLRFLLAEGQDVREDPRRVEALDILWALAVKAACFGALSETEIAEGYTPFLLPPVPSERLLFLRVITAPEEIWQVRVRQVGRAERGKGPPENRVLVKAANYKERERFALQSLSAEKPLLLIEEHYTIAIPELRNAELDRVRFYALYREGTRHRILLVGQTQEPHAHFTLRPGGLPTTQRWYRIDSKTHPSFEIPSGIPLPETPSVTGPTPATDEQIATLMTLFVEGTRQTVRRQPNRDASQGGKE